jgi:hypothetical protein
VLAALIGLLPLAALSAAALSFVGLPYGSAVPRLDWTLFAVGLLFGAGALSVAVLGVLRTAPGGRRSARQPLEQSAGEAESHETDLYMPLVAESARKVVDNDRRSIEIDEDVRVTRA